MSNDETKMLESIKDKLKDLTDSPEKMAKFKDGWEAYKQQQDEADKNDPNIIICEICGTKWKSPIPLTKLAQKVTMKGCPSCKDIQELLNCKIDEYTDRVEIRFNECSETKQPAEIIFNKSTGMVMCRNWKKCKMNCKGACVVPEYQKKVAEIIRVKRHTGGDYHSFLGP